jgi:uncharacterized protein YndB with AHSA1/START domain
MRVLPALVPKPGEGIEFGCFGVADVHSAFLPRCRRAEEGQGNAIAGLRLSGQRGVTKPHYSIVPPGAARASSPQRPLPRETQGIASLVPRGGRQNNRIGHRNPTSPGVTAMPNTVRLHRVIAAKPEKVYRAFIEPDAQAKWLPPDGFTCTVHRFEPRAGGTFKMSFRNFTTGESHSFGGEFIELVPHERIRYTDEFDDPNLPGTMKVTVTLKKVSVGTEINIEQSGVPDAIPLEACYLGWQQSLKNLAQLVEPEINQ